LNYSETQKSLVKGERFSCDCFGIRVNLIRRHVRWL